MKKLTDILNLSETATADEICASAESLASRIATLENQLSTQSSELSTLKNTQSSALTTAQTQLAAERTARIELILENALERGRITLAQRADWQTKFEKDFASAETQLANTAPALNTISQTRDLGEQKQLLANEQTAALSWSLTSPKNKPAASPTTTPGRTPKRNAPPSSNK